jgi:uncharacterized protein YaaW (UPF0174 family)
MAYRRDSDLEFLSQMASEDLGDLVYCLTHDRDGCRRHTEELTSTTLYKAHHPDHQKYWELIAAELQCFGANTLATILRGGEGVLYKEVLVDVCDKLKVNYSKDSSVDRIEQNLLMKILTDALDKMSPEQLKELAEAIGMRNVGYGGLTAESMAAIFQALFHAGGFKSYQLTLIIVNVVVKALIGRGLTLAGNALIGRTMAILTGPIGMAITALMTLIDIAGPAYRVTIPSVILVAALRQKQLNDKLISQVSFT